jgi:hypothetical protein
MDKTLKQYRPRRILIFIIVLLFIAPPIALLSIWLSISIFVLGIVGIFDIKKRSTTTYIIGSDSFSIISAHESKKYKYSEIKKIMRERRAIQHGNSTEYDCYTILNFQNNEMEFWDEIFWAKVNVHQEIIARIESNYNCEYVKKFTLTDDIEILSNFKLIPKNQISSNDQKTL